MLRNQNVFVKIMCTLAVLLFFYLVVGGMGLYSAKTISGQVAHIYSGGLLPVGYMDDVRLLSKDTESKLLELIQQTDPAKQQAIIQAIDENTKAINKLQEQYMATDISPLQKEKFAELEKELPAYRKARADIIKSAVAGKQKEAFALFEASKPVFAKSLSIRAELSNYNHQRSLLLYQESAAASESTTLIIIGVTIFAVLLSAVLGLRLARSISIPLKKIVIELGEIANGDLLQKPKVLDSQDELGQLADAISKMCKGIRALMLKTSQSTEQVAASAEELTASADQSAQAANQIAQVMAEVASGTEKQRNALNNTSSVIGQMSASVRQIAANSDTVTNTSAQSADAAYEGSKTIDKAIEQMGQIEETVSRSGEVVSKLGERSREVGQIIDTISGIAGQTNLLALNAAIEAARAGEQGRGFAVVAEEVRKLAEQSQEAAKQIASLITEIQIDTENAVAAMNDGTKEVRAGTEVVNAAGRTFKEISRLFNEVTNQIRDISEAIQQMALDSRQIVASIQEIDTISKETADHSQTVSSATEEQLATIEEFASSSQSLAKLAQELTQMVNQFQV